MAHKEYGVTDIIDILRRSQAGDSLRRISRATGMDRKTLRNYLRLATTHGFGETVPEERLPEIAADVFRELHGETKAPALAKAWEPLVPHKELLSGWLEKDSLTLTKAHIKLDRMGVKVRATVASIATLGKFLASAALKLRCEWRILNPAK